MYARLNQYSDEMLVIGVLYQTSLGLRTKYVEQKRLFDVFSKLVNDDWIEQLFFSVKVQEESLDKDGEEVSQVSPASSLLKFGRLCRALIDDADCFFGDVLRASSIAYGQYRVIRAPSYDSISQKEIEAVIRDAIVQIDPFRGRKIVSTKRVYLDKQPFEIPLFGERLIAAPISVQRANPFDARSSAEHWLVRLKYATKMLEGEGLRRSPHLYLYAPSNDDAKHRKRTESITSEIRQIGNSIDVAVSASGTIDELAKAVYRDEGATE